MKMSKDWPVTRQKDQKDGDPGISNNSLLQELRGLSSKMDRIKSALERQLNSKVDSLRDLLEKLVIENRDCLKAELMQKTKEIQNNVARIECLEGKIDRVKHEENMHFDPSVSVVISGMSYKDGENVMDLVKALLDEGLQWENLPGVVAAERRREREGHPEVIMLERKVDVL